MSTRGFVGYKKDGVIKGWYNHSDSYPGYLGTIILEILLKYQWTTIKNFFKRLKLVDQREGGGDPIYESHKDVYDLNWQKASAVLQDASGFIKDGLYCEYAYVFDLDSTSKRLMLFTGFCTEPSKGYEDYYYECSSGKSYVNYVGALEGKSVSRIAGLKKMVKLMEAE